ncbi:MAG: hypothetical protein RL518_730 [Pseudomonadota bacterium]|jgi:hypothetical protein
MFHGIDNKVKVQLAKADDGGGSSSFPTARIDNIRIDSLHGPHLTILFDVFARAFDHYASWDLEVKKLKDTYGDTAYAKMVDELINGINNSGPVIAYREFGASTALIRDSLETPRQALENAVSLLNKIAIDLQRSSVSGGSRRSELLAHLAHQIKKEGPYKAFDEIGHELPSPFTRNSQGGQGVFYVTAYVAAMLCENPPNAFSTIIEHGGLSAFWQVSRLQEKLIQHLKREGAFASSEMLNGLLASLVQK